MVQHGGLIKNIVGISSGRTSGKRVPRVWVILSEASKRKSSALAAGFNEQKWIKEELRL